MTIREWWAPPDPATEARKARNRPSRSHPGQTVCACGRGFASEFDGQCGRCREEADRRRKRRQR